ncbi:uncharacterized protein V6R79_000378 [Siganus canaliculatus]
MVLNASVGGRQLSGLCDSTQSLLTKAATRSGDRGMQKDVHTVTSPSSPAHVTLTSRISCVCALGCTAVGVVLEGDSPAFRRQTACSFELHRKIMEDTSDKVGDGLKKQKAAFSLLELFIFIPMLVCSNLQKLNTRNQLFAMNKHCFITRPLCITTTYWKVKATPEPILITAA